MTALAERVMGAELGLIAAALADPDGASPFLHEVPPEDFTDAGRGGMWGALRDGSGPMLLRPGFSLELQQLANDLRASGSVERPGTAYRRFQLARRAADMHRSAQLMSAAIERAPIDERGLSEIAAEFQSMLAWQDLEGQAAADPRWADGIGEWRDIERRGSDAVIPTTIPELDEFIGGGINRGGQLIATARSGHGKSVFALQAAVACAQAGGRVLYCSCEMPRYQLLARASAAALRRSRRNIGRALAADEPATLAELHETHDRLRIDVDCETRDVSRIVARLRAERAKGDPYSLVVVDYMQEYMHPKAGDKVESVGLVATALKDAALANDLAVLSLAQPSRDGSKRIGNFVEMSELRGSSVLENAADSIVSLLRDEEADADLRYDFFIRVQKARHGRVGTLQRTYTLHGPQTRIEEKAPMGAAEWDGHSSAETLS